MNAFSPFDHSSQTQMSLPQMTVPLIQQPDQALSLASTNLVESPSGNLFAAFLMSLWVAFVFFHLGMRAARRQTRYYDRAAIREQHVQTLERIWQLSAKRND
ncbi:MAG: hypothetical protein KME27_17190 [Lyngbya sp. HA4199-MV5]|jgi:hypothetical protein|nr:hypothetical protein [Lyngbya sp. HA4199-MV5]